MLTTGLAALAVEVRGPVVCPMSPRGTMRNITKQCFHPAFIVWSSSDAKLAYSLSSIFLFSSHRLHTSLRAAAQDAAATLDNALDVSKSVGNPSTLRRRARPRVPSASRHLPMPQQPECRQLLWPRSGSLEIVCRFQHEGNRETRKVAEQP